MNKATILSIAGGLALALATTASAQPSGAVCNVGKGTAVIGGAGLNGSAPADLPFAFSNDCGGAATQGCAIGTLGSATCAENLHSGAFIYCATGSCALDCDPNTAGVQACTKTNVSNATFATSGGCVPVEGTFQGICLGNLCLGSTTADVIYLLAFDQATSSAALATCPAPPVGTGGSLNSASFSGVIVY